MQPTEEIWRPVVGFEGAYEVSDHGRVRSVDRWVTYTNRWGGTSTTFHHGQILRPGVHVRSGHLHVNLHRKSRYVHQLVLEAFVGPRPDGMRHTRHMNGIPADNRVENLAWGTFSENYLDSVAHGTHTNAAKTYCKWGHEFTPENTIPNSGQKNRACRECARIRGREWARNKRRESKARG